MTNPLPIKQLYSKSLAISPLILYTIVMLKERNGKADRLYKKITKSFEKALDIKHRIGQNSQLHSFTASQLHSFTASQLRARHARIINSQPNTHQILRQQAYRTESFLWCAFFILHRFINRKERKALSFAQLRKGL